VARVTRLEPDRARSRRWVVELDGDLWRALPRVAVQKLGLELHDDVDADQLAGQLSRIEPPLARERALYLLDARERSSAELSCRLTEDGYAEAVSGAVVATLASQGLVDDERFAEVLARSLVSGRGYGRARVSRELARRGVSSEAACAALDASCPLEDEPERAIEAARRIGRGRGLGVQKLAARLARRGFAPGVAYTAARTVESDDEPAPW
jgi:regulatory protein